MSLDPIRLIRTERLVLRAYRPQDALEVYEAVIDSAEHLGVAIGLMALRDRWEGDPAKLLAMMRAQPKPPNSKTEYGIFADDGGRYLGAGSIIRRPGGVSLGYWLRSNATGQGYATEAVRALAHEVLRTEPRVFVEIHNANTASLRVAERVGFGALNACEIDWPDGPSRPGVSMVLERDKHRQNSEL